MYVTALEVFHDSGMIVREFLETLGLSHHLKMRPTLDYIRKDMTISHNIHSLTHSLTYSLTHLLRHTFCRYLHYHIIQLKPLKQDQFDLAQVTALCPDISANISNKSAV